VKELFDKCNELNKRYIFKFRILAVSMCLLVLGFIAFIDSSELLAILCSLTMIAYIALFIYFYSPVRKIKKEIKVKLKAYPEIRAKYKKFKRRNLVKSAIITIVIWLIAFFVASVISSSGGSGCCVCGDESIGTFGGNNYCEEHYNAAVLVTFDKLADKT
jgi:di/tricarboxylate transporter